MSYDPTGSCPCEFCQIFRLRKALKLCASQAGLPDPAEACRQILKTIKEALREHGG